MCVVLLLAVFVGATLLVEVLIVVVPGFEVELELERELEFEGEL